MALLVSVDPSSTSSSSKSVKVWARTLSIASVMKRSELKKIMTTDIRGGTACSFAVPPLDRSGRIRNARARGGGSCLTRRS